METAVDDPLLVDVKFTYTWQGAASASTPARPFHWIVPRSRLPQIRDTSRDRIACERMVGDEGCPIWILPEPFARVPPSPPGGEARDRICPPAGRPGDATPLIGDATLEAGLLPSTGHWERIGLHDGGAANAYYAHRGTRVRVTVRDMIRSCTGAAGSTDTLLDTEEVADPKATRRRVMSATSAVLVRWPHPGMLHRARLVLWIADRCRVVVEPVDKGVEPEALVVVGRAVDVAKLEAVCSKR